MMRKSISFFLLSAYFACSCSDSHTSKKLESNGADTSTSISSEVEKTIDVFDIPSIQNLYIINSNGSFIYEKPNKQSAILDTLEYGYRVEVIGEEKEWYQIKERIGRSFIRDGKQIASSGWEVVYIPKGNAGAISQIKLKTKDLYETNDKANVKGKLEISLIGKNEFESSKSKDDHFVVPRKALVSSMDSVLAITLNNGLKKEYISLPNAEDEMEVYHYVGHVDYLKAYLLAIGYYEGGEYKLYNTENGTDVVSFNDYPYFSPDGSYVVSVYTNPYDQTSDFQLYTVGKDQKVKKELEASFNKWMVALEPQEVYWVNSSTIVLKVLHAQAFWDENGGLNNDYQYLKIKIR